jgi:ATP-dependent protease Clp ATPase subunit
VLQVSEWGHRCPVMALESEVQILFTKEFPAYYNYHIYFPSSNEARKVLFLKFSHSHFLKTFILHPKKYTKVVNKFVALPLIVPNVFVIGTPKSGKTTLANYLATSLGAIRLTMTKALRLAVESPTNLGKVVNFIFKLIYLFLGETLFTERYFCA